MPPTSARSRGPRAPACDVGALELSPPSAVTGASSAVTPQARISPAPSIPASPTTYRFQFGKTPPMAPRPHGLGRVRAAERGCAAARSRASRLRPPTTTGSSRPAPMARPPAPIRPSPPPRLPIDDPAWRFSGVRILTKSARADRKGRVSVKLRCPAAAVGRCKGKLSLTAKVKRKDQDDQAGQRPLRHRRRQDQDGADQALEVEAPSAGQVEAAQGLAERERDRRQRWQGEGQEGQAQREGPQAQA